MIQIIDFTGYLPLILGFTRWFKPICLCRVNMNVSLWKWDDNALCFEFFKNSAIQFMDNKSPISRCVGSAQKLEFKA
jgi:hypothetical protein